MRGYWHFNALSVLTSILTIIFDHYWFALAYFFWLFYLFYDGRLGRLPILTSLIFYLFFSFYIPTISDVENINPPPYQTLSGKVISPLTKSKKKVEFTLQEQISKEKYLMVFFPPNDISKKDQNKYKQIVYGATCKITGNIQEPMKGRNPGQFDFSNFLSKKGIAYQMIINSLEDVSCEGSSALHRIHVMRVNLMNTLAKKMEPKTTAWLNALILGDDSQLDVETIELFQRWGLSHILAISGLHVGLIIGLIYFMLVKLSVITKEKAQWIVILFLPFYAVLAGGQPSVWRACIMTLAFIVFKKMTFKFSTTDTLSIVFLTMILFDKYIVYHIGFQLSFAVTFGLIISKKVLANTKSSFFQMLLISFISQMMILPLQLNYFSTFQPLSILLNVLVAPYFSLFVIPLMFLLLLFSFLPNVLISGVDHVFTMIHDYFLSLLHWIDQVASFPFTIGEFPVVLIVMYYCLFYMFMKTLQNNQLIEAFKYGMVLVGLIMITAYRPFLSPVGTVTMLDIGQGDAFVIELPYRKGVFLIDAGANFSFGDSQPTSKVYKQIIKPFLYSRGITKIDAIFLSHEDLDHIGSVPYILNDMKVDEVIISNYYQVSDEERSLLAKHNVKLRKVGPNENVEIKGQTFQVLGLSDDQQSENENSLVLYMELGGMRWLFTGDIGKETERKLINIYDRLSVDVLKVGHHGSKTSTDPSFIQQISPDYALVSVGANNSYGHPAAEVIETLQNGHVKILRTDESGAVQYIFNNNQGTFLKHFP